MYAEVAARLSNCDESKFYQYLRGNDKLKDVQFQLTLIDDTCIGLAEKQTRYAVWPSRLLKEGISPTFEGHYWTRPGFNVKLNK